MLIPHHPLALLWCVSDSLLCENAMVGDLQDGPISWHSPPCVVISTLSSVGLWSQQDISSDSL